MSNEIGRNSLCPCGSGKKYKNCCQKKGVLFNKKSQNKVALFVLGGVVFLAGIISISKISSSDSLKSTLPSTQQPVSSANVPLSNQAGTPTSSPTGFIPQPGPAPPGKVWSPEHGHWHDAQGTTPTTTTSLPTGQSSQLTPQPPGPAPEGKVWSPEHGHWHDAPGAGVMATPISPQTGTNAASSSPVFDITPGQLESQNQNQGQTQLIPQPPGPAPEGKVWSPEHGHWHDAPVEAKTIQVTPAKTDPK